MNKTEFACNKQPELKLWYDEPAKDWESEALPLGNGFLGGMVFGGVETDIIQINEHSLWSGGPGASKDFQGGMKGNPDEIKKALKRVREILQHKAEEFSLHHSAYLTENGIHSEDYSQEDEEIKSLLSQLMGDRDYFGDYQSLGDIVMTDLSISDNPVPSLSYRRELNLEDGTLRISYEHNGITYIREYFVSYPDNILVIRLSADHKGMISKNVAFSSEHPLKNISVTKNSITIEGTPQDQQNEGLKFAGQIKLVPCGGTIMENDNSIDVQGADELLIVMSAGTNYLQCMDESFQYFKSENPLEAVNDRMDKAAARPFQSLYEVHLCDYKSIFGRVKLNICEAALPKKSTKKLLLGYHGTGDNSNTPEEDLYLENLYYQYGRYLLIASSREGTLPANLQGIWAQGLHSPWNADYHTNINLQMNYWLAEQCNLGECHLPLIDYIRSLVPRGILTAQRYYCKQDGGEVRGWVIHHENSIWGNTAPGFHYTAFYFPAAAAWLCLHIWEHYEFYQDKEFLKKNYDIMQEAAIFWVDNLWEDSRDKTLVANPSYSPEHGPYSIGVTCDQSIIWELFDKVIKAGEILGESSKELDEIIDAKSRLYMPQIGLAGQMMEWKDEVSMDISGDNNHRHANHLFTLHPGTGIIPGRSDEDDRYVQAIKKTLNTRGDGSTGWSKAWKINFWARLQDGNRAHKLVQEILKESTLTNLFDTHPPFQIDGNLGATAGMTEMLLQSHGNAIVLFPSLPDSWANGSFCGLKARGNFEISAEWTKGKAEYIYIKSGSGLDCGICYDKMSKFVIKKTSNDTPIDFSTTDEHTINFHTEVGETYCIQIFE